MYPPSAGRTLGRVRRFALVLAALLLLGASSCGGDENGADGKPRREATGPQVFALADCGGCHTLAAAGSRGTIGPNLDQLRPSRGQVVDQVVQGGNGMPSFASKLTRQEIDAVAEYVSDSAKPGQIASQGDPFKPDATKLSDCADDDGACWLQAFGNLSFREGPKAALQRFQETIATNPAVEANCHPIAHAIGAGALKRFHGDVGHAIAGGAATCGSGYYHGVLEWKLAGLPESQVASVARRVCEETRQTSQFIYYQCVHGLGHGLMLYTRYDLPGALGLCHKLVTSFDQVSCSGGVFMENQQSSYGYRSKWLKTDDLLYPCDSEVVTEQDKLYCYLLVTSYVLPKVGGDWTKVAGWCRKSDATYVATCFQSMGRDASGSSRQEPKGIRDICAKARPDGERECLYGAARDILNNDSSDLRGRELCESVPRADRSYCFFGLGSILGVVYATGPQRKQACAQFAPKADRKDCEQGAGAD
jgi:mono/diheme cytochrome c family protein